MVALPVGHPLTKRKSLVLADLAREGFILGPNHTGNAVDPTVAACVKSGFSPRIAQQALDPASLLVLVASGVGITVLPASSGHLGSRFLGYRPLRGPLVGSPLYAAWKPSRG